MALAVRVLHGTASSPNTIGRVLVHLVMLSRASGSRFLVDPEEVFSRSAMANGAELPLAPRPQPQPEKLVHTDRGVMLSTPLSSGDLAKAMKYAATMKCSNTCPTSYDGVCSDGAIDNFIISILGMNCADAADYCTGGYEALIGPLCPVTCGKCDDWCTDD